MGTMLRDLQGLRFWEVKDLPFPVASTRRPVQGCATARAILRYRRMGIVVNEVIRVGHGSQGCLTDKTMS
jgi:hypothetical protein